MKKMIVVTAILVSVAMMVAGPVLLYAAEMSTAQLKALERTGIPVYPGATYVTGDESAAMVIWFGTTDPPEKIMDWYRDRLSGWSETSFNGTSVIYKGPKGLDAKALSAKPYSKPYLFARSKDETPEKNDAEITVLIPK